MEKPKMTFLQKLFGTKGSDNLDQDTKDYDIQQIKELKDVWELKYK